VFEALGDPDGVLIVDETGFLNKGDQSVGVARQYSGTAGRIENAQVGVFLAYASRLGQALIDRRLCLPESWAGAADRRAKAHVPPAVAFATKIAMAREMIGAALDAGALPVGAGGRALRRRLSSARHARDAPPAYVLAVRSNQPIRAWTQEGLVETDPKTIAANLPTEAWTRLAAGEGVAIQRSRQRRRGSQRPQSRRGVGANELRSRSLDRHASLAMTGNARSI
jgi:SRSO17 transposase